LLARKESADAIPPVLFNLGLTDVWRTREQYVNHRRNDQRNASFWNVDVKLTKEMILSRGVNLQVSAEIFNLLDDKTYTIYNEFYGIGGQVNGNNDAYRRWGRSWQLGFRAAF